MANDRLFIACDHCGAFTGLAKYFPSNGISEMTVSGAQQFAKWMTRHFACNPAERLRAHALDYGPGFVFLTEKTLSMCGGQDGPQPWPIITPAKTWIERNLIIRANDLLEANVRLEQRARDAEQRLKELTGASQTKDD